MSDIKITIGADAAKLQSELKKAQSELSKTALAAQKTDSSLQVLSKNAGQSMFNLKEKILSLQSSVFTEKDRSKITLYNAEIKKTEAELAKLQALGGGGGGFGAIGKGATQAFSAVRQLAYILPGVGIAGILAFATEPIINFIGKLFEATDAEKKLAEQAKFYSKFSEEVAKNYGEEAASLKTLRVEIENSHAPMSTRLQAIKDLRKEFPGYFEQLSNEQLLNGSVASAYDLATAAIIRRARATAATLELTKISSEQFKILQRSEEDEAKTNKLIREAKPGANIPDLNMPGFTIKNVTAQKLQQFYLQAFNIRKKADQEEMDQLNKKEKFLLNILQSSANAKVKIEQDKVATIKIKKDKGTVIPYLYSLQEKITGESLMKPLEPEITVKPILKFDNPFEEIQRNAIATNEIIKNTFVSSFEAIGEGIGDAISGKGNIFGNIFSGLFKALGAGLKQLGAYAIATSKLIIALKASIGTSLGIVGGIALIALGSIISSAASKLTPKFATGTRNFSGGTALVGERGPELLTLPSGSSITPNAQLNAGGGREIFIAETVIRGTDLVTIYNRATAFNSRNS